MQQLKDGGLDVQPIEIEGRKIAKTFWGIAWNEHLESFGDYANRIPRGRTYVRNGSVCHLDIQQGKIEAHVSGSSIYRVEITIRPLPTKKWKQVKSQCAGQVGSMLELLQGKLSSSVMAVVTDRESGLFPAPGEIELGCSCPDVAYMCKHIAAVLYGVGARLDHRPELLFALRGVDHEELISADVDLSATGGSKAGDRRIAGDALADVFGIDLSDDDTPAPKKKAAKKKAAKKSTLRTRKAAIKTARKNARKKAPPARASAGKGTITGVDIASLRETFRMTRDEFAYLAGVSPASVKKWEGHPGELTLRRGSRAALERIGKFSKSEAWDAFVEL